MCGLAVGSLMQPIGLVEGQFCGYPFSGVSTCAEGLFQTSQDSPDPLPVEVITPL